MLIDETDEELLDKIDAVVCVLAQRHPDELTSLRVLIWETVEDALED